jgi:hypothetical protein
MSWFGAPEVIGALVSPAYSNIPLGERVTIRPLMVMAVKSRSVAEW